MAKLSRRAGATSQIFQIYVQDTSSSSGAGLTGLTSGSSGLTAYYHRDTDTTATAISLTSMTAGTFTSSGFIVVDGTNMPGLYQFCPPNAALAAGASSVVILLKGATNMAPVALEIDLDPQVDVYLWNGTAVASPATAGIPDINVKNVNNVAAATPGASGGMLISGSNAGMTTLAALTVTGSFTISDGLLVARSSSNTSAITATGNGTGSGIIATSGSGATGDGIKAVAASTNGNGVTLTHAGSGADLNATTTPLTLAKTTNITGFNDIAASAIVSSGAITTSGGKVSGVILADTVTTYTGDTPQTGDAFARLGVAGVGLTNLGDTRVAHLDADVTSRMATYTQPTGFLAATFPSGTVANTTNITAGTITTVTNLTNAPSAGDFTSTMKTSLNAATPASVVGSVGSVTGAVGSVTARVTANTDQFAGQTVTAASGVTLPGTVASPTNITAGTITTATNLTNAPTSGDFTSTMKTSIGTAVAASAVASVTGNVGGNVTGSVGSVTGAVTVDGASPLTEAYPGKGAALTLSTALYSINQQQGEVSISGTTRTVLKRDASTPAMTFTLNSATAPTATTQAT